MISTLFLRNPILKRPIVCFLYTLYNLYSKIQNEFRISHLLSYLLRVHIYDLYLYLYTSSRNLSYVRFPECHSTKYSLGFVLKYPCKKMEYHFYKLAPEGKRSVGLSAVWVARNRFAVLDRAHTVHNL